MLSAGCFLDDMTTEPDTIADIRELLESQSTMTLATADEHGQPHASPLFFYLREDLTLYWLSSADSRHSANLRTRPQASIAVYAAVNRWEKIRGVQSQMVSKGEWRVFYGAGGGVEIHHVVPHAAIIVVSDYLRARLFAQDMNSYRISAGLSYLIGSKTVK